MAAWINRPWIEELLIREEHSVWLTRPRRGQVIQILSEPKKENDFNACIVVSDKKLFVKACLGQNCLQNFFKQNQGEHVADLKGVNVNLLKYKIRPVLGCKKNKREFQIIVEELDSPGGCKSSQFGDELINASRFEPIEKRLTLLWRQLLIYKLSLDPSKISLQQHRRYREISPADQEKLDQIPEWRSDFVHKPSESSCSSSATQEHQPSYAAEVSPIVAENLSEDHNLRSMGGVQSKEIAAAATTETGSNAAKKNCQQSSESADPSVTNDKDSAIPISSQSNATCRKRAAEDAEKMKSKLVRTVISAPDTDLHFVEQTQGFDVSEDGVSALKCRLSSGEISPQVNLTQNDNVQENTQDEKIQDKEDGSTESVTTDLPPPLCSSVATSTSEQVSDNSTRPESVNDSNASSGRMQLSSSRNADCHRPENNDKTRPQMVFTSDDESDNNEGNKYEILINSILQVECKKSKESPKKSITSQEESVTKSNASDRKKPESSLTLTTEEKEQSNQEFIQGLDNIAKSPEYKMLKTSRSRISCSDPNDQNTRIINNAAPNDDQEDTIDNAIAQPHEDETGASAGELKTDVSNHAQSSMADSSTSNIENRIIAAKIREGVEEHLVLESENVCNSSDAPMNQCLKEVNELINELTVSSSVVPENDAVPDVDFAAKNSEKEVTAPIDKPQYSEQDVTQQDRQECSPSMATDSSTTKSLINVADDTTSRENKSSNNGCSEDDEKSAKHTETSSGQSHQHSDLCGNKDYIMAEDPQETDSSYKNPLESEVSSQGDMFSILTPHGEQQIDAPTDSQKSPSMSQLVALLIDSQSGSLYINSPSSLSSTQTEIATDVVIESSSMKDSQNAESLASQQGESEDAQSSASIVIERNETDEEGHLENTGSSSNRRPINQSVELVGSTQPEPVEMNSGTINKDKPLVVNNPDSKDTPSVSQKDGNLPIPNASSLSSHSHITVEENETLNAGFVITPSSNLDNASSLSEQPECVVSSQGDTGSLQETSGTKPDEQGVQNEASSNTDSDKNFFNSFSPFNISENIVSSQSDAQQQPRETTQTPIEYGDSINISELSRLTPTLVDSQSGSEIVQPQNEDAASCDKPEPTDLDSRASILSLLDEHDTRIQQDNISIAPSLPVQNNQDATFVRPQPILHLEKDRKRRQTFLNSLTGTSDSTIYTSSSRTETSFVDTGSQSQREKQKRKFDDISISDSDSTDFEDGSYPLAKRSKKLGTNTDISDNEERSDNQWFHATASGTSSAIGSNSSTDETDQPPINSSQTGAFSIMASQSEHVSQETEDESPWRANKGSKDTTTDSEKHKEFYSARVNNYEDWLGRKARDYCFSHRAKTKLADRTIDWSVFKRFHPNIDHLR